MNKDIQAFNTSKSSEDELICNTLMNIIDEHLNFTESKIWHAHPVWFIEGNPIVGYASFPK